MQHSSTILLSLFTFLPSCAYQQVSYEQDITPIFVRSCNGCHIAPGGPGYRATGLKMDSYESIIQGTIYGPVIVAGDSRRSILNMLVEGRAGNKQSKPHGEKNDISGEEIEILKRWVDQGALNN